MRPLPTLKRVPADSVPYGMDISRDGRWVWAAFDGDRRIAVGATKAEASRLYDRARYLASGLEPKLPTT
jgi:hypothetical protein